MVVVDAGGAPSRGAWFEGRPCGGDKLPASPPGIQRCSWDLADNFWAANFSSNVWFNQTGTGTTTSGSATTTNTPTFPGGCAGETSKSCGPTRGCACRSWDAWKAAGKDSGSLWQQDPMLQGELHLVTSPAVLALGIEPLTELVRAGSDWQL